MKQFSITIEPGLVNAVDEIVEKVGLYSSRNDFVRDAVRARALEIKRFWLREDLSGIAKTATERGWNGSLLSKEEKKKIAAGFLKAKGIK